METFGTVVKDRSINDAILTQAEYEVPTVDMILLSFILCQPMKMDHQQIPTVIQ